MRNLVVCVLLFLSNAAMALNLDRSKLSVSGLSSGAYAAGQLAVANSAEIMGVGVVAGGPYYCAQGSLQLALNLCSEYLRPKIAIDALVAQAKSYADTKLIDSTSNLSKMRVYALSGQNDAVVSKVLVESNFSFFSAFGATPNLFKFSTDLKAGHAFPTLAYGNPCETARETPFISNCGYDTAGEILNHIYNGLKPKAQSQSNNFYSISQTFEGLLAPKQISMGEEAIAYIPDSCLSGAKCKVHMALHGCRQTRDDIGEQFIKNTGYVDWAESNNMVIIFPQAVRDDGLGNPRGCWDWWGYTSPMYATKSAPQLAVMMKLIDRLADAKIENLKHIKN